jgi:hypothetical protein
VKTLYSSTCPAWHDTRAISKAKWAQITSGETISHRSDRSVTYSQLYPATNDTQNVVLGKILQSHCDAPSTIEVEVSAVTNFETGDVTLSWPAPSGSYPATAGYVVYRDSVLLANVPFGTNTYVDTTGVSGHTYAYSVLFHAS